GPPAGAGVATKDQAAASLALVPLAIVAVHAGRLRSVVPWLVAGGVAAAAAFALFFNLPFNSGGFAAHVGMLASWGGIALVPRTAAGYAALTRASLSLYRLSLGWPLSVMAAVGVASAAWRRDRRWWGWLALTIVSFHLFFACVSLFVTDRYQLGGTFVLALFAGAGCADLVETARGGPLGRLAVALVLGFSLLNAASIHVMMHLDARYDTRRRLAAGA